MGKHVDRLIELAAAHPVKSHKRGEKTVKSFIRGGEGPEHRATVQRLLELQREITGRTEEGS